MKKLILYDHQGTKLLEQEVFVEGQDFRWQSPKPTAFWLGEICLVDKEPEPEPKVRTIDSFTIQEIIEIREEEKVEPTEVDNQSAGDRGVSETSEPESIEGLPEQPAGEQPPKRSKKPRKREAA